MQLSHRRLVTGQARAVGQVQVVGRLLDLVATRLHSLLLGAKAT